MQPEHLLREPNPALRLSCLWSYYREHFRCEVHPDENVGFVSRWVPDERNPLSDEDQDFYDRVWRCSMCQLLLGYDGTIESEFTIDEILTAAEPF